jgi:hypothetical protein
MEPFRSWPEIVRNVEKETLSNEVESKIFPHTKHTMKERERERPSLRLFSSSQLATAIVCSRTDLHCRAEMW